MKKMAFGNPSTQEGNNIVACGILSEGRGEGAYFLGLDGYLNQIEKKFGFTPFPGTFNIRVEKDTMLQLASIASSACITLQGFRKNGKIMGNVNCLFCKIEEVEGVVVIPEKKYYNDVIEVMAPVCLRKALSRRTGDEIIIEIY